MDDQSKTSEPVTRTVHGKYALELTLKICVMCLFAGFYGFVWPPLAAQLQLQPFIEWIITLSTQAGIAFYMLYQIPRTLRLFYDDWIGG